MRSFRRQRGSRGNIYRLRHDFARAGNDNPASLHGAGSIEDAPPGPDRTVGAVALLLYDRSGAVGHSAFVGGAIAGWFYAHLLGFGRTSLLQRILRQRRLEAARLQSMRADQFVAEEIDPLLEKISQRGLASLSRRERRLLEQAREKMLSGNAP